MSDEETKYKHSKRIQSDENKVKKQLKIAKMFGIKVEEPHKYHKQHVMNCGNPNCVMCGNPRKMRKDKTLKEMTFEDISKEQY